MSSDVMDGQGVVAPAETVAEPGQTATTPAGTAATEVEQPTQDEQQPKTFTQEDIDRAVRLRVAREQRRYERRIGELEARVNHAPAQPAQSAASAEPQLEQFKSWDDYQRALVRHEASKVVQEQESQRRQHETEQQHARRMQELSAKFETREAEARKALADYDDVVQDMPRGVLKGHVLEFIGESDVGPHVLYALANDLDKARQISAMTPMAAARALAKMETEVSAPKPVSKAPAPVASPKGIAASASDGPSDKDDAETWMRKRMEQLKARR